MGDKISIILPDDLKKEIDKLRDLNREDQSTFIRKLLWKSVTHEKLEIALKNIKKIRYLWGKQLKTLEYPYGKW